MYLSGIIVIRNTNGESMSSWIFISAKIVPPDWNYTFHFFIFSEIIIIIIIIYLFILLFCNYFLLVFITIIIIIIIVFNFF